MALFMTVRLALAAAFFLCGWGFCLAANHTVSAIVDAINEKLPADDQFSYLGWYPGKVFRVHREYRRLYPDGGLLRREGILVRLMFLCLAVAAGLFGFGLLGVALFGGGGMFLAWLVYKKP